MGSVFPAAAETRPDGMRHGGALDIGDFGATAPILAGPCRSVNSGLITSLLNSTDTSSILTTWGAWL